MTLRSLPVCLDLLLLRDRFEHYRRPNKKVFDLKQAGLLFAVRRGQYLNLTSDHYRETPLECIANALHGPSYVSLEWGLQYYGLIPERVHQITSVTTRRSWRVSSPVGNFAYEHLNQRRYPIGYEAKTAAGWTFLIATPAKSLLDLLTVRMRSMQWGAGMEIEQFLEDDLRLDIAHFLELTPADSLHELRQHYHRNSRESRLLSWFLARKGGHFTT